MIWDDERVTETPREPTPEAPLRPKAPAPLRLEVALVPEQTGDDTDTGWGTASNDRDPAATLKRYLDETPPHHGD